jgi:hypothetical protein
MDLIIGIGIGVMCTLGIVGSIDMLKQINRLK